MTDLTRPEEIALNPIQPVSDDFSTDGYLPEFARVDHQHPLSESLRAAIFSAGAGTYVRKTGDTMSGALSITAGGLSVVGGINLTTSGGITFPNGMTITGNVSDTWMRFSSNIYNASAIIANDGYLSIGYGGATDATYRVRFAYNVQVAGVVAITGGADSNGNLRFSASNPYIYAPSYLIMPGGLYVSGVNLYVAPLSYLRGGVMCDTANTPFYMFKSQAGTAHIWYHQQATFRDDSAPDGQAGFALYAVNNGVAPIIRCYGNFAVDRVDFLNNPNTAYIGLYAGSYNIGSSERIKKNIEEVEDDELLSKFEKLRIHKFQLKIGPMNIRPSERFKRVDAMWQAKGRKPLIMTPQLTVSEPHDCAIENCIGDKDNLCPGVINETSDRYGLIAEHLHAVVPGVANIDLDGLPESYAVDQIAAMAFGGVGALLRRIEILNERVLELESRAA